MSLIRRLFFAFWESVFRALAFIPLGLGKWLDAVADRCEERAR